MLVMIMMGVWMMGEGITFDRYEEFVEVVAIRRFMSEEFGRWKWNHDTLAATIFTEKSTRSVKGVAFEAIFSRLLQRSYAWPARFEASPSLCNTEPISPVLTSPVIMMAHSGLSVHRPIAGNSRLMGSNRCQLHQPFWIFGLLGPLEVRSWFDGLSMYDIQTQRRWL